MTVSVCRPLDTRCWFFFGRHRFRRQRFQGLSQFVPNQRGLFGETCGVSIRSGRLALFPAITVYWRSSVTWLLRRSDGGNGTYTKSVTSLTATAEVAMLCSVRVPIGADWQWFGTLYGVVPADSPCTLHNRTGRNHFERIAVKLNTIP